ncbi:MAG: helix-turn-helix transcriptional regulator [Sphingobacteriales bacterium]|nr:helix-turn-helix transcriptional regulator [Sphingobacteriales bacterium]
MFVRKGATIVEQFNDEGFCVVLFFIPDDFLCETLKTKSKPISTGDKKFSPIIPLDTSETLKSFFVSIFSYFSENMEPDQALIELKFKELVLMLADNPNNAELLAYFCSMLQEPQSVSLQRIMEDNFSYNLKMEEYAVLCTRSLSAFKRDFKKHFNNTPGKWLLEKRLQHAHQLLQHSDKNVNEAAFESGFENTSHFSRSFKERFGYSPVSAKSALSN